MGRLHILGKYSTQRKTEKMKITKQDVIAENSKFLEYCLFIRDGKCEGCEFNKLCNPDKFKLKQKKKS